LKATDPQEADAEADEDEATEAATPAFSYGMTSAGSQLYIQVSSFKHACTPKHIRHTSACGNKPFDTPKWNS
jgi:hypothetical protein